MKIVFFFLVVVAAAGCSSISVQEETAVAALAPASRPKVLWVRPFQVLRGAEFDAADPAMTDETAQHRVGRLIAEAILVKADELIAPARILEPSLPRPTSGLLIEGKVLRTRQGSRALRLGIGFGAGRSRMDVSVRVYYLDLSATEPWLAFETTGGSNVEPGLIGMLAPSPVAIPIALSMVGGGITALSLGGKGVSEDAQRTGRVIAAAVHDQLAQAGSILRQVRVKRSGRLLTPLGEVPVLPMD